MGTNRSRSGIGRITARWLYGLAVLLAGLALAACGSSESDGSGDGGESLDSNVGASAAELLPGKAMTANSKDITEYCGEKDTKLGIIDGFGGNAWRKQTRAQIEKEAAKCPNITEVLYVDANIDPQKFNGTIDSWVTQGVNIIVAYDDFGQIAVPTFAKAEAAGTHIGTHNALPGDAVEGEQVTAAVRPNAEHVATKWAEFFSGIFPDGKGNIIMLGGTPGNLLDPYLMEAFKKVLVDYPDLKLLQDEAVVTNWDFGEAQRVTGTLINKYPNLDGIVMSYGAMVPSIHRAYKQAGKPMVPVAGIASSNEAVCLHEREGDFEILMQDGTTNESIIALRKILAKYQGIENDEPTLVDLPVFIDSTSGVLPTCEPDLPDGADTSAEMTVEELKQVFTE